MLRHRAVATCIAAAVSLAGTAAMTAPAALASAGHRLAAAAPAGNGSFTTWAAAQKAAGFKLLKPTRLHGLARSGKIHVATCEVTGQLTKHEVGAVYGNERHTFLGLDQANSPHPCGDIGDAKPLGVVKVDGVKAHLFGFCGRKGEPSCSSKAAQLTLIWEKKGVAYITQSHGETRAALLNFSRTLHAV